MDDFKDKAQVRIEKVTIPTYGVGDPDKNPMFFDNRTYQGSSGRVYPLPIIEKIFDTCKDETYTAVILENEYIRVTVLPELGGRIQRAYDKTNGYDFVYYNEVIKPALVGLLGPWISGGIEFNWPQHHRPTTFCPVDYCLEEGRNGKKTVVLSEVDQMYGTKGETRISVEPGRAAIEIKGKLYNGTCLPQTFLWWANPAVAVNDNTQSVFPPDVHAVFDHGKRDVSRFPIATGVYYKHDYSAGVDISRYKNIPVPTSYMCAHSDYDFVGGYDYGKQAGLLHVADHHIAPGKKQWTWGCGDFGKAWDRNLTDKNGPYIELMTGVFTDNQPDFTWLAPYEEKNFTQYFLPYKKIGYVKNANKDCALSLSLENGTAHVGFYAVRKFSCLKVTLTDVSSGNVLMSEAKAFSPENALVREIPFAGKAVDLRMAVTDENGRQLLSWQPEAPKLEKIPDPMPVPKRPEQTATTEELYLTGRHLEQYRHAHWKPDPYYLEALSRDPGDIRSNTAYGELLIRRGEFEKSLPYFDAAIRRATQHNPNPQDSACFYEKGLALFWLGRFDAAYAAFYKSVWSSAQQEMGFFFLALIDCRRGDYETALEHIEMSLVKNAANLKAQAIHGAILHELNQKEEAQEVLRAALKCDPFAYACRFELSRDCEQEKDNYLKLAAGRESTFVETADLFAEAGFFNRAEEVLALAPQKPLVLYRRAFLAEKMSADGSGYLSRAAASDTSYVFPNRLEDEIVLSWVCRRAPEDGKAPYYLGCELYAWGRRDEAIALWGKSSQSADFPTVYRNLALGYFNVRGDGKKAREELEKAFAMDRSDARVLMELDQLYGRLKMPAQKRLAFLNENKETAFKRDDVYLEYCTLLNILGRYQEALDLILARHFHPWEGGEGKVSAQYMASLTGLAKEAMKRGEAEKAEKLLASALVFPETIGEGKLEGEKDNNIWYLLGKAQSMQGKQKEAEESFRKASAGNQEPAGMLYYNDQPAEMILYQGLALEKLGRKEEALSRYHKLLDYGEQHYFDHVTIDYYAVSLPDLKVFDDDLDARNRVHCEKLMAMGYFGLGDKGKAEEMLTKAKEEDPYLQIR